MGDAIFEHPRLAEIYDDLDAPRDDLDAYLAIAEEVGADSVVDVGCGTGTFACLLAARGLEVTGVDPATASLAVARRKPGAHRVRWIEGDATTLPPLRVDLATMTGNVGQVFLRDEEWSTALRGIHRSLRPGGWLTFEVRDPGREAWRDWTRAGSHGVVDISGAGPTETWVELTDVSPPLISFRWTYRFLADDTELRSDSTLRFRSQDEVHAALTATGFEVADVRGAPDRPGLELVFLARRPTGP